MRYEKESLVIALKIIASAISKQLSILSEFFITMTSTVRQRKKTFARSVEDLDAFPKVPDSYVEQEASSAIGKITSFAFKMHNF